MTRTAVQFGAGNIGRGFIAQLFHESGLEVVFVDVVPAMLDALNERGRYTIHIVGPGAQDVEIDHVRGVPARSLDEVAEEIARCEIACTAVGANNLVHAAPGLAAGLELRHKRGRGPLNILICENLHSANEHLRQLISDQLQEAHRADVLAHTGFVQAVVSRMVPLQRSPVEDPLGIRVEAYKRLPIDGRAIVGTMPQIVGVEAVPNFEAYVERKLYTHNCAHAALGYLGWRKGIEFGWQAIEDPEVSTVLTELLIETGSALIKKHGFSPDEHRSHVDDLLRRFENAELGDTCFRLARDPIRKLAPSDRLVGAARLCESQGVESVEVPKVIAAALKFDAREDPAAQELRRRISRNGIDEVLRGVCRISPEEPLGRRIKAEWEKA